VFPGALRLHLVAPRSAAPSANGARQRRPWVDPHYGAGENHGGCHVQVSSALGGLRHDLLAGSPYIAVLSHDSIVVVLGRAGERHWELPPTGAVRTSPEKIRLV
jgi:hypothetical protein